ncbi:hypothetical protein PENSPDRAFT_264919 [Peniophora sp. CONT]|nr:hypothetical protein PENSPDRAFT_264919 [Peniophora sp. CONT]
MLPHVARFEFDTMGLWLEATEVRHISYVFLLTRCSLSRTPRRYRIILILGGSATDKIRAHLNITHFVEFRTDDDVTENRLPRADYISIRAYACKVAHMASVSRYFDDVKALVEMVAIAPFLPSSMLYIYASSNSQTLKTTYA